jgi:hypothetical protein
MSHEEDAFKKLQDWLKETTNNSQYSLLLDKFDEASLDLVKEAFLSGFDAGRVRRNKDNWDLWNQK